MSRKYTGQAGKPGPNPVNLHVLAILGEKRPRLHPGRGAGVLRKATQRLPASSLTRLTASGELIRHMVRGFPRNGKHSTK